MPTACIADRFDFTAVARRRVEAGFDGGDITSEAGALLLGATDRTIGLIDRFAACFEDRRCQGLVEHSVGTLETILEAHAKAGGRIPLIWSGRNQRCLIGAKLPLKLSS
ncbi:MAG: transposase [Geminicoccaceae bacterium]